MNIKHKYAIFMLNHCISVIKSEIEANRYGGEDSYGNMKKGEYLAGMEHASRIIDRIKRGLEGLEN